MRKIVFVLFTCLLFLFSCGQDTDASKIKLTPTEKNYSYHLGDSLVKLVTLQYGKRNDIVMLNLHDDEATSVQAAQTVLEETGGLAYPYQ